MDGRRLHWTDNIQRVPSPRAAQNSSARQLSVSAGIDGLFLLASVWCVLECVCVCVWANGLQIKWGKDSGRDFTSGQIKNLFATLASCRQVNDEVLNKYVLPQSEIHKLKSK